MKQRKKLYTYFFIFLITNRGYNTFANNERTVRKMSTNEMKTVQRIRQEYVAREQTKFDELKELNARVQRPAQYFAYGFGIVGSLVLGTGMCLAMKIIGDAFVAGIIVGLVGIAMVSLTYPIYKSMLKSRKQKYAAQVLKLSDELLNK